MSTMCSSEARASARSDAHCPRPGNVANMRGLPARGRSRPKKLVRHRQQHPVRLATLNVGTLTGESRELADSLRKRRVDICCVQETRWKGSKSRELGDGYKLISHGTSNRNGVDRLSDCLMAVKVETGEVELRVVSAYTPQVDCSEEEEACFWEDLEQYVQSQGLEETSTDMSLLGKTGSRVVMVDTVVEPCRCPTPFVRHRFENLGGKEEKSKETQRIKWWNLKDRKECGGNVVVYFQPYTLDRGEHPGKDDSRTRQSKDRGAYLAATREAKKAVFKAKTNRYKAVYDMLGTREGERGAFSQSASSLNVGYRADQDR
ncbi:hypothetical protein RB195_001701 [Necator americanus]|uniref:Endonuclease/exonuclease/phosphatase domain-containing protein n=1 Tax=Necator americanus TaxID=51031 RepID=A0ABR1DFJ0_NECAM